MDQSNYDKYLNKAILANNETEEIDLYEIQTRLENKLLELQIQKEQKEIELLNRKLKETNLSIQDVINDIELGDLEIQITKLELKVLKANNPYIELDT